MAAARVRRPTLVLRVGLLFLFLAFLVYATFFAQWRPRSLEEVKTDILAFGAAAPLVAVGVQAVGIVLLVPSLLLVLATALVFGLDAIWISLAGQVTGSVAAFLIARHVGRDPLHALLGQRLIALERALESHGFRTLLLLRLASILPGPFLVYAPGLVGLRLRQVVLAAALGDLPFIVVLSVVGNSLGQVGSAQDLAEPEAFVPLAVLGLLLSLPTLLFLLVRSRRRARARAARGDASTAAESGPPANGESP